MASSRLIRRIQVHVDDLFVNMIAASPLLPRLARVWIYRRFRIDTRTRHISPRCFFGGEDRVTIGPGTFVNYGCFFERVGAIHIGADCAIGMNVAFVTSGHAIGPGHRRAGALQPEPVTIGDGCWIGAGAIILPGTVVGSGCIVASGTVVAGDCAPDGLYAGNPARRVRDLPVEP